MFVLTSPKFNDDCLSCLAKIAGGRTTFYRNRSDSQPLRKTRIKSSGTMVLILKSRKARKEKAPRNVRRHINVRRRSDVRGHRDVRGRRDLSGRRDVSGCRDVSRRRDMRGRDDVWAASMRK